MFPSVKTRFASAARRGFDLAVEFATLGEFGLSADAADPPPKSPVTRPTPIRVRPSRVKPATPAARRLQPVHQRQRISTHSGVRELAFDIRGPRRALRRRRTPAGAPQPPPPPGP